MNVLSLFDGKSSGFTAMEMAGLPVTKYYSSEVSEPVIQVSEAIHPNQTRLGDVTKWKDWDLDWSSIDLVMSGFPCQAWSMSGKQEGDRDERGKMFWVMLDIIKKVQSENPDVQFLIENVRMKSDFEKYITSHTERALGTVYKEMLDSNLVSAQNRKRYYWTSRKVRQPEDEGIRLIDILESTPELPEGFAYKEKSKCLRVGGTGSKLGDRHEWDSPYCILRPRGNNSGGVRGKDTGKTPCLTSSSWENNVEVFDGMNKRRFTIREMFRLQTCPEHYIDKILDSGISKTQLSKIAGNGWTDKMIAHILREMFLS